MAISDWFKKAKEAKKKKADEDKAKRADEGQKAYEKSKGKPAQDAWTALDE